MSFIYSIIGWKLSGEKFSETKFLRTLLISVAMSLGLTVTGVTTDIYSNSLASTLVGIIGSKYANYLNEVPTETKTTIQKVVNSTVEQISPQSNGTSQTTATKQ